MVCEYNNNESVNDGNRMERDILDAIMHRLLCVDAEVEGEGSILCLKYGEVYQLSQTVHHARMAEDDCELDMKELEELEKYLYNLRKKGGN